MAGLLLADSTQYSALVVCACGARFAATARPAAWRAAAEHVTRAHPEHRRDAYTARLLAERQDR